MTKGQAGGAFGMNECRKVGYRTRLDAKLALMRIGNKRPDKTEKRIYWCETHKKYHLTSRA